MARGKRINVYLSLETLAALDAMAKAGDRNRSQQITRLVREATKK